MLDCSEEARQIDELRCRQRVSVQRLKTKARREQNMIGIFLSFHAISYSEAHYHFTCSSHIEITSSPFNIYRFIRIIDTRNLATVYFSLSFSLLVRKLLITHADLKHQSLRCQSIYAKIVSDAGETSTLSFCNFVPVPHCENGHSVSVVLGSSFDGLMQFLVK